jgi:tripartite-type tricarboxylate transporter receptor subunit TctC
MKLVAKLLAGLLVLLAAQTASAQSTYPNRPIKILVGFTPGTAPDVVARILADTPAEFAAVIKKETPAWAKVIKDADIKLGN